MALQARYVHHDPHYIIILVKQALRATLIEQVYLHVPAGAHMDIAAEEPLIYTDAKVPLAIVTELIRGVGCS